MTNQNKDKAERSDCCDVTKEFTKNPEGVDKESIERAEGWEERFEEDFNDLEGWQRTIVHEADKELYYPRAELKAFISQELTLARQEAERRVAEEMLEYMDITIRFYESAKLSCESDKALRETIRQKYLSSNPKEDGE